MHLTKEQVEELQRDAERYRWLRHNGAKFPEPIGCMTEVLCDEDLDRAIDAYAIDKAMKAEEPRADYEVLPDGSCKF
jgi:hypothetical protein